MNDVRDPDPSADQTRNELIELFLKRTLSEVERMRRNVPRIIAGDVATWRELWFDAQRITGTAHGLDLDRLSACADELAGFAAGKFAGRAVDAPFLLGVTSAIEMLAIEVNRLCAESKAPRRR